MHWLGMFHGHLCAGQVCLGMCRLVHMFLEECFGWACAHLDGVGGHGVTLRWSGLLEDVQICADGVLVYLCAGLAC